MPEAVGFPIVPQLMIIVPMPMRNVNEPVPRHASVGHAFINSNANMKLFYSSLGWVVCFLFITGCKPEHPVAQTITQFNKKNNTIVALAYSQPILDSIILEPKSSSMVGKISILNAHIFFVDSKLSMLYEFDRNGTYLGNHIGHGNGPDQLPIKHTEFFSPLPNGGFLFIGPSFDCFVFDGHYKRLDDYEINWHRSSDNPGYLANPDPNTTDPYTPAYVVGKLFTDGNKVFFPLLCQHRNFNPTFTSYATSAKVMAEMDLDDGYITGIFGALSPIYRQSKANATLAYANIEALPDNQMVISYPADSSLYLATRNFRIIKCFGKPGRAVKQNYASLTKMEDFWRIWYENTQEHGYYRDIKFVESRELLFRSYQKNAVSPDGLQIYKNDTLIADFDTPRGFDVSGYIPPYFYSNAFIDEDKGQIKIYRFKL